MPRGAGQLRGQDPASQVNAANREATVFTLRCQGWDFTTIAQQCGYTSPAAAHKAWKRALARIPQQAIEEMRQQIFAQQLWAIQSMSAKIARGDTFAVKEMTAIHDRMAKLFGLDVVKDAPAQAQMMIVAVPQPVMEAI